MDKIMLVASKLIDREEFNMRKFIASVVIGLLWRALAD